MGRGYQRGDVMSDTDFDFSEYIDAGDMYAAGADVSFEFVDSPRLNGDEVEFSFRTAGGATAPPGSVVAQLVVMSTDNRILGGGKTTVRNGLGPGETGATRINLLQYILASGAYYLTVNISGDTRNVEFRIEDGRVHSR
jgi:hypothetical protein